MRRVFPMEWKGLPPHDVPCGRCGHRPAMHTNYANGVRGRCQQLLRREHPSAGNPTKPSDWCDCPGYMHPAKYPVPTARAAEEGT